MEWHCFKSAIGAYNQGVPRLRDLGRVSDVRGSLHLPNNRLIQCKKVANWSDREVVTRWRLLYPWQRDAEGRALEPTNDQMSTWLADKETLSRWRKRLGDLSWVMRSLNESLARRLTKRTNAKGDSGRGGSRANFSAMLEQCWSAWPRRAQKT